MFVFEQGFIIGPRLSRMNAGGVEQTQMSLVHLYAARGGSAAYLSQPTLTGRFLISSHCQPEHLRRLLPPVTCNAWEVEMKGGRDRGERERRRVGRGGEREKGQR